MDEEDFHIRGHARTPWDGPDRVPTALSSKDPDAPEFELGRMFFSSAWSTAANEGLISDEEYVVELIRHTRAENERTMPGIPWPKDRGG